MRDYMYPSETSSGRQSPYGCVGSFTKTSKPRWLRHLSKGEPLPHDEHELDYRRLEIRKAS
ncbi:hypothetical protein Csa_012544 [Cucumis sativus]|uniref:Uncharacterized protein n=1 Tax=Cucumis sativus TaxID=3659 RepID=A0A0A0L2C4_CUCSA|nr:hypothetical protein Csa_012544 [Cucumis sativus]